MNHPFDQNKKASWDRLASFQKQGFLPNTVNESQAMVFSPQVIDHLLPGTPPPVRDAAPASPPPSRCLFKIKYLETLRLLDRLVAVVTDGCDSWPVLAPAYSLGQYCSQECQDIFWRAVQLSQNVSREIDHFESVFDSMPPMNRQYRMQYAEYIMTLYAEYKDVKRLVEETDLALRNVQGPGAVQFVGVNKRKLRSSLTRAPKRTNTGNVDIPDESTPGATQVAAAPVGIQRVSLE